MIENTVVYKIKQERHRKKRMNVTELFLIAVGLSMDAFAVSICKGLSMKRIDWKKASIIGFYFGIFQAGMPLIGYLLGVQFKDKITAIDHWIAFVLLGLIGINMIHEALKGEEEKTNDSIGFRVMLGLAVATSIDALAVGVTFAFLKVDIISAIVFIGITTLVISIIGVKIGTVFGTKYKTKAELAGGVILVLMGIKILIEHLFF